MTAPATSAATTDINPLFTTPWSVSAARAARLCPRKWANLRNGVPHDGTPSLDARRGMVLHACLAAAWRSAQEEGRNGRVQYPGTGTMYRHYPAARRALGFAWTRYEMPASSSEANECLRMITDTLRADPLPRPGEIVAVERSFETVTRGGLPVVFKPDLVTRPATPSGRPGPRLDITDWKTGSIDKLHAGTDDQLLTYAALLAALIPGIRQVRMVLRSIRYGAISPAIADPSSAASTILALESVATRRELATSNPATPGVHCERCPFLRVCDEAWGPAVTAAHAARYAREGR